MTIPPVALAVTPDPGAEKLLDSRRDARLREAAHQLEGVFVSHLFKAMREAVPEGGLFEGGPGQDVFTQLFDEELAQALAQRLEGSLGDMLYRQLREAAAAQQVAPQPGG